MPAEQDLLADLTPGVRWSAMVRDAATGAVLAEHHPERVLRTASVGKVFCLLEVARQLESGELDADERLTWTDEEWVADSGLWYRMGSRTLGVADLAVLVGAVSDNLATNVLVRRVGLPAIRERARAAGCRDSALLDRVRPDRGPEHPPTLSQGSAGELSAVLVGLQQGTLVSSAVSERVRGWLAANTDLSMVAAGLGLDPLAHDESDNGVVLVNKTGTISVVRADIGLLSGPARTLAYAVLAEWDDDTDHRDDVLAAMREVGIRLRGIVRPSGIVRSS